MKIAILSDTHGLLRPEVVERLKDADAILHGGDINKQSVVDELRQYAPRCMWCAATTIRNGQRRFRMTLWLRWTALRFTWFTIKRRSRQIFPVWTWWCSDILTSTCRRKRTGHGGSIPGLAVHGSSIRKSP